MIGNNSCGAHSAAYGKTVDNVEALEVALYDGTRLIARHGRRGRRPSPPPCAVAARARFTPRLRALASVRPTDSARATRKFRAASPATISTSCCPIAGFNLARALVGSEGTLGDYAGRDAAGWCRVRDGSRWWCSASTTSSSPPTRCRGCWSIIRKRSKASIIICPISRAPRDSRRCACCPMAARSCSSNLAADTADERVGGGRAVDRSGAARARLHRGRSALRRFANSARSGACASRDWAPARSSRAIRAPGRAPRIPRCRRRAWAITCAVSCGCSSRHKLAAATYYGHFGEGCVHCRSQFRFHHCRGDGDVSRRDG